MQRHRQRAPTTGPVSQYDRLRGRYYVYHDPDSHATLASTVAHALADVAGVEVTDGEFSLYDSVDPDALERLFADRQDGTARSGGHVAFSALGHDVVVYSSGDCVIYPPREGARPRTAGA